MGAFLSSITFSVLKNTCTEVLVVILKCIEEMWSHFLPSIFQLDLHVSFWKYCFFFPPQPITEMAFGRRVGRRTAGVAGPGADGDGRSSPLFTVCILNLHRSCHKGSGSRCLEASWELIFSSL